MLGWLDDLGVATLALNYVISRMDEKPGKAKGKSKGKKAKKRKRADLMGALQGALG